MIEIAAFNAFYKQKQVLYDISVTVKENSITALIGPSGSGKTTLLKSVNRTAELTAGFHSHGAILLKGEAIYEVDSAAMVRRQVGMVMQKPLALPLSIKENILFGPRYYGAKNKAELDDLAATTLMRVGLWDEVKDRLNLPASELSGGQLQRLSIGRSLAISPTVLLLDEPCSSLDIKSTQMIEQLLVELSEQLTIVVVTHNLGQAKRIAAETVFMSEGRVIESNVTEQLFKQPQYPATQEFLTF
jgi:phosphate transport system ATP-binding protein